MAAATIPVTVAADAAARIAELGMQREFEHMIEHAKQTAPGLRSIRVTLEYDPECPTNDPGIVIWVHREDLLPPGQTDLVDWEWGGWQARTFPCEVCAHFVMISVLGGTDGR